MPLELGDTQDNLCCWFRLYQDRAVGTELLLFTSKGKLRPLELLEFKYTSIAAVSSSQIVVGF